jgi:hypothetical protein
MTTLRSRVFALLLALVATFSLTACGDEISPEAKLQITQAQLSKAGTEAELANLKAFNAERDRKAAETKLAAAEAKADKAIGDKAVALHEAKKARRAEAKRIAQVECDADKRIIGAVDRKVDVNKMNCGTARRMAQAKTSLAASKKG